MNVFGKQIFRKQIFVYISTIVTSFFFPCVEAVAHSINATRRPGQQTADFVATHRCQTCFECPVCKVMYTTHNSLVHHVGTSHSRLTFNITFKCAQCDYVNANLRATSSHYKSTHGAAVPPVDIDGSIEKACPFCHRTFPWARSCSMHIRVHHMKEASKQQAREATEKDKQRGTSTHTKWGDVEIEWFKVIKRLGPTDNTTIAKPIGTRDKFQVATFKCRFFKAYPTWLEDNFHLSQPPAPAALYTKPPKLSRPLLSHQHHPTAHGNGYQGKACQPKGHY